MTSVDIAVRGKHVTGDLNLLPNIADDLNLNHTHTHPDNEQSGNTSQRTTHDLGPWVKLEYAKETYQARGECTNPRRIDWRRYSNPPLWRSKVGVLTDKPPCCQPLESIRTIIKPASTCCRCRRSLICEQLRSLTCFLINSCNSRYLRQ